MYKVLLVDDEPEIRYGLIHYFPWNEIGFEVVSECHNGKKALEYITNNEIDVLFSDIQMPVMNGLELAEEVVKRELPIKIILLSGYRDFEYARKAIKYGVYDYIIKPSKFDELYSVLSNLKKELDPERTRPTENPPEQMTYSDNIIETIKNYVNEHYSSATLEDAATLVHMSANYVSTYFKNKTGENFSTYVHTVRMKKAAAFILDSQYKIYDVSTMVGYSNPKNFTRMFIKFFGKSPREYRKEPNRDGL
ncbi:response regulator [Niallia sp. JL1B1071]|uniref:response regulator transcription factor n=1 Tax=Niallia tiangongensis TaxID=3237105 RepID=UPI0037DD04B6